MISPATASSLRDRIDRETSGLNPAIAGISYLAVDWHGDLIFSHASGSIGLDIPGRPLTIDNTLLWLASCTKLITGIACMQLVEQGRLALDDVEQVEKLAPELRDVKVLVEKEGRDEEFELVEKDRSITLRMLLTHTSGFGYAFDNAKLRKWAGSAGLDDFSGCRSECLNRPLVHQPGTAFEYGVGVDWAGVLVERVTNMSLEQYFQTFIFKPLGLKNITFFPNADMKSRLAYMHQRDANGILRLSDHLYRYPFLVTSAELEEQDEDRRPFCMGGAGCFGVLSEYVQIIATLLNDGTSPKSKAQILKQETVKEMFTDQIPNLPRRLNVYGENAKPWLANPVPILPARNSRREVDDTMTEGWGLTFSLSHNQYHTGRAPGSASWEGLANLFWFADRENGIGGIIASQILPYGDVHVLQTSADVEEVIYAELSKTRR